LESFTHLTAEEIAVAWKLAQKGQWRAGGRASGSDRRPGSAVARSRPETTARFADSLGNASRRPRSALEAGRTGTGRPIRKPTPQTLRADSGMRHRFGGCPNQSRRQRSRKIASWNQTALLPVADSDRKIQVRTDQAILSAKPGSRRGGRVGLGGTGAGCWWILWSVALTFTLRWIPPGEFLMGSPEDEPGRWRTKGRSIG
jgi:hypothetical protein